MKIMHVWERDTLPVIFRRALLMSRAWRPHEPRLEADLDVAHLPLELRLGHEGRDGVDDDDVHRAAAHKDVRDLQGLLARVRLRDEKLVRIDAESASVGRIECVLGVDEGGDAPAGLRVGRDVQSESGLARRFGAEDLNHTPLRDPADADGFVQAQ